MSYSGITEASQIGLPLDQYTVLKAVNVGGSTSDSVNGIAFEADRNVPSEPRSFTGNGYMAEGSGDVATGIVDAAFTQTTVNIPGLAFMSGEGFSGLTENTDYVFDIYLSGQGPDLEFVFSCGFSSSGLVSYGAYLQNQGPVNLLRASFNTGSSTFFNWSIITAEEHRDATPSGYVLYQSAVPEPSTVALFFGALGVVFLFRRRRSRPA